MSVVFCLLLVSGRFGALASFFCRSAFSARSLITSASELVSVSAGVGAEELNALVFGRLSVRAGMVGNISTGSIGGNWNCEKDPACES